MTVRLTTSQKIKVATPEDIYLIMRQILLRENKLSQQKEHFWIVGLSQSNVIMYIELVSLGSINATVVNPMEVYNLAVLKKSVQIITVHNHPSGNLKPSAEDKRIMQKLKKGGKLLGIELIDNLIISTEGYSTY